MKIYLLKVNHIYEIIYLCTSFLTQSNVVVFCQKLLFIEDVKACMFFINPFKKP